MPIRDGQTARALTEPISSFASTALFPGPSRDLVITSYSIHYTKLYDAVKAAKKIEAEFSRRDQELQSTAKQLQGMQQSLEKNALTMAESDRRAKEKELNELSREFQRKQREFREDLNLRSYNFV